MMPTDPEARIYFITVIVLSVWLIIHMVITMRALRAVDRLDNRIRILRSQLAIANRALEHWKMTDRQRGYTTAAAGDRELESPAEAAAAAVHSLDLPVQHGTLPEHRRRTELIAEAKQKDWPNSADLIAEMKETT